MLNVPKIGDHYCELEPESELLLGNIAESLRVKD